LGNLLQAKNAALHFCGSTDLVFQEKHLLQPHIHKQIMPTVWSFGLPTKPTPSGSHIGLFQCGRLDTVYIWLKMCIKRAC